MYSLISKFEGETLRCLSRKICKNSLDEIPSFSLETLFVDLKSPAFEEFRNEFKIQVEKYYIADFSDEINYKNGLFHQKILSSF